MVHVSQVMIAHTITCQIHTSRHTTPLSNELICSCSCTEILALLTMKLELLSPLLSDSPFLSSKVFCFFRFSNLTVEWTKWNHACWGPRKLSILDSFLVFPRPVNFFILLPLSNLLSWWKIHKNFRQKPRPRPAYFDLVFMLQKVRGSISGSKLGFHIFWGSWKTMISSVHVPETIRQKIFFQKNV
jgi:hypothetical protein